MIINNIPLTINVSKNKKVSLNLNTYRNLHYQANNKAKHQLATFIKLYGSFDGVVAAPPFEMVYTIYRRTKIRADLMNIGSIVDKYVSDALVTLGYFPDDNTDIIKKVTIIDGGIDKENPRANLEIKAYRDTITQ